MEEVIINLLKTSLFKGLENKQILKIRSIIINKYYHKDQFVFMEKDKADGFYIVAEGKIKIFKISIEGKEQILHIYGPGNIFGEVPVFYGKNFPASALVLQNSHLLFLLREKFIDLIKKDPSLSMNMLAELSSRLKYFTSQIESISLKKIPSRLASYLAYLSNKQKNIKNIQLKISKGELSSLLGITPESLSRTFKKMIIKKIIQVYGKSIEIKNYSALMKLKEYGKL